MGTGAGAHGGVARGTEGGKGGGVTRADSQEADRVTMPIIEISDKDYRSFCWPCYALEETGDGKPGD